MRIVGQMVGAVGMSLLIGFASTGAFAVSKRTAAIADADVRELVRLMDKDMNGTVSKDEFIQFVGQTFDRLDINRNGQLERPEMRQMTAPKWLHIGVPHAPGR